MKIFDGILICTDLDGTLLRNDKSISEENLRAIEFFKREGGYFTFITGRMPFFVSDIHDKVKPNVPFGCVNGGGLYDFARGDYIWKSVMPQGVNELIRSADEAISDLGIQVNTFYKIYFCRENETMRLFRKSTGVPNLVGHYDSVSEPIAKIVFGSEDEETILELERLLRSHPRAKDFDFIRSEKTLFEILPKGICKGTAIVRLAEHLGIDVRRTVAVGDYNNDISMFGAAGVGIAVSNACKEALDAADLVTVSNQEHAIARIIYDIRDGIIKL